MPSVPSDAITTVLSEIKAGGGLSLAAAGRRLPGHRGGRAVAPSTVYRWVVQGTRTPAGGVVRLEAARVGGRWLTSSAALDRYATALTTASAPPAEHPTVPLPSPAARSRAADRAAEALIRTGA